MPPAPEAKRKSLRSAWCGLLFFLKEGWGKDSQTDKVRGLAINLKQECLESHIPFLVQVPVRTIEFNRDECY